MKKLVLGIVTICMTTLPATAAMNFYRAADGQLVAEATDCRSAARLGALLGLPDDPPDAASSEDEPSASEDSVDQGIVTLAEALLAEEPEDTGTQKRHGVSKDIENLLDETSFDEWQDSFITFVRDVNWKTGLYITFRDYSLFYRLKMACQGISQLTRPLRMKLDNYSDDLDESIEKIATHEIDSLAQAARSHSFSAMSKLSVLGLAIAIEKENPFLLLAMDEETYNKLIEVEPKIETLFEDMYTFFAIRSVRMGDYNANVKSLIRISKLGKGDAFNTWHVMAEYSKKMLELQRQNKLTVQDERDIHIWRLESSLAYIKEHVRVEKRAAELAVKDPDNASLVEEVKNGPKKKLSLDDKARALLQRSTQDEIKKLIHKYKGK